MGIYTFTEKESCEKLKSTCMSNGRRNPEKVRSQRVKDEEQLKNVQDMLQVLAAEKICDPRVWPKSVEDLAAYGKAEVDSLVQNFRPALERNDFDFAAVAGEWSTLKACVTENNFRNLDPLILFQRMFTAFKDQFPNTLILVDIIFILPLATATVKRGFSAMKRVENDWRSCLVTFSINGSDVFEPQRAIQHWWTSGERACRPDFQRNTSNTRFF